MKVLCRSLLMLICVLAACCFTQTVFAEEKTEGRAEKKQDSQASHYLDEITVSGKVVKEPKTSPYVVPESSVLATDVITAEEIEQMHPKSVWDILEFVPGMMPLYQGNNFLDSGNMRGNGNFQVIVDGVYFPAQYRFLGSFPVETIESMTVVRDSSALTIGPLTNFGSGTGSSNQGFIVIKTKRASSKVEGGMLADYGSFHTDKEHVYLGGKTKEFDGRAAYTHRASDGRTNWNQQYRDQSVLLRGGYTKEGAINADMIYYTSRGMRGATRAEIGDGSKLDGTLSTSRGIFDPLTMDMVGLNMNKPWNARHTTTMTASYSSALATREAATYPKLYPRTSTDQDTHGYQIDLKHNVQFKNNFLKVGGQMLSQTCPAGVNNYTGKRSEEDMYSLFAWDEHHLFDNKVTIDGGIRAGKKYYGDNDMTGHPRNEWDRPVYSYAAGIAYKPTPTYTLTGRYAYSENTVAAYQVDATTRSFLPAERRNRYEGGVLANFHPAINPWVTVYYYDTKNEKTATGFYIDPATGEEMSTVSNNDVKTKGAEFGFSGAIIKSLSYRFSYSYVNTDNRQTNLQIAHNLASGQIGYKYKNFDTNLMLKYASSMSQSSSAGGVAMCDIGDFTRVDANIGYNFKVFDRSAKFMVYGQNLGDVHYTTRYIGGAFKDPGRVLGAQFSCSFF